VTCVDAFSFFSHFIFFFREKMKKVAGTYPLIFLLETSLLVEARRQVLRQ
jgi:hypothetical protein